MEFLNPPKVLYRDVLNATMDYLLNRIPRIWKTEFENLHVAKHPKKKMQAGDASRYVRDVLKQLNTCFPVERTRHTGMAADWVNTQQIFRLLIHTEYLRMFARNNRRALFVCRAADTLKSKDLFIRLDSGGQIPVGLLCGVIRDSARLFTRIYSLEIVSVDFMTNVYESFTITSRNGNGETQVDYITRGVSETAFFKLFSEAYHKPGSDLNEKYQSLLRRYLTHQLLHQ